MYKLSSVQTWEMSCRVSLCCLSLESDGMGDSSASLGRKEQNSECRASGTEQGMGV